MAAAGADAPNLFYARLERRVAAPETPHEALLRLIDCRRGDPLSAVVVIAGRRLGVEARLAEELRRQAAVIAKNKESKGRRLFCTYGQVIELWVRDEAGRLCNRRRIAGIIRPLATALGVVSPGAGRRLELAELPPGPPADDPAWIGRQELDRMRAELEAHDLNDEIDRRRREGFAALLSGSLAAETGMDRLGGTMLPPLPGLRRIRL